MPAPVSAWCALAGPAALVLVALHARCDDSVYFFSGAVFPPGVQNMQVDRGFFLNGMTMPPIVAKVTGEQLNLTSKQRLLMMASSLAAWPLASAILSWLSRESLRNHRPTTIIGNTISGKMSSRIPINLMLV